MAIQIMARPQDDIDLCPIYLSPTHLPKGVPLAGGSYKYLVDPTEVMTIGLGQAVLDVKNQKYSCTKVAASTKRISS